jgi:hypothetical protein
VTGGRGSAEYDEFERIRLTEQMEKDRRLIAVYEANMAEFRRRIEDTRYELGRLDERLGG